MNVQQAVPAPLNYAPPGYTPYPKSICTSINHQVCHGIPNDRPLKNGDIVNIDVTVIKDGWHGDTSRMFIVGEGSIAAQAPVPDHLRGDVEGHRRRSSPACAWATSATRSRPSPRTAASRWCASSAATASAAKFHEEPQVLHYGRPGTLDELVPGMMFTIEPMINAGRRDIRETGDGWTIVTKDRSLSAQWEHTVLVTETGYEVMTLSAGSPPPPAFVTGVADGHGLRATRDAPPCRTHRRCGPSRRRVARALSRRQGGADRALPRLAPDRTGGRARCCARSAAMSTRRC